MDYGSCLQVVFACLRCAKRPGSRAPGKKKKKAKPKQFEEKLLEASLLYVQAH